MNRIKLKPYHDDLADKNYISLTGKENKSEINQVGNKFWWGKDSAGVRSDLHILMWELEYVFRNIFDLAAKEKGPRRSLDL